jgi:peroxiredoxin Q/BCP
MAIEEGAKLPDIELAMIGGGRVNLRSYAGRPFVLYFYPKDDTSGCTRQAQDFSTMLPEFQNAGAELLGVSKDPPEKHAKFIAKYDLTIALATDDTGLAIETFGSWVEKSLYGRKYMGIDRSTFLFGADGKLARIWRRVKVPGHATDVLEAIRELA